MAEPQWFLYQDNAQQGPMPLEALRGLARPDSLVTRIGMSDWVPARTVPELFPELSRDATRPPLPPGVGPRRDLRVTGRDLAERVHRVAGADDVTSTLPHLRLVRGLLDGLRRGLTESNLGAADLVARQAGHLSYIAAALVLVLTYLVLGVRLDSFRLVFGGVLLLAPAAVLLHYLAALFLDAGSSLLRKSPSELSSSTVLSAAAVLFFAGAVVCFGLGLYRLILGDGVLTFGVSLGAAVLLLYACGIALNPATVNVHPGTGLTAGEEALGISMFLLKIPVRLVPFLFGVGAVVGLCAAFYALYLVVTQEALFVVADVQALTRNILGVALLPLLTYLEFALAALLVEVLRAILRTPARIEALRSDVNGSGGSGPAAG